MTLLAWQQALTQMEDELNAHEEALRKGQLSVVPGFSAPDELGPVPIQLVERVSSLVRRIGLLATFVQYQLVATDNDLRHLERGGQPNGAIALYLDASV